MYTKPGSENPDSGPSGQAEKTRPLTTSKAAWEERNKQPGWRDASGQVDSKPVHKIGAIIIRDRRLLLVKKKEGPYIILPGGKLEAGENAHECLARELSEELSMAVVSSARFETFQDIGVYGSHPLKIDAYFVQAIGEPRPGSEISEALWFHTKHPEADRLSSILQKFVVPRLVKMGLID